MQYRKFIRPKRWVQRVFIHCSASDNPDHDNVSVMDKWHRDRGWNGVGYHFFIQKNGTIQVGRNIERTPAAQRNRKKVDRPYFGGGNEGTIAICLHGLHKDKFTMQQRKALVDFCSQINNVYNGEVTFHGHREIDWKECPVIDYKQWLSLDDQGFMPYG